MESPPNYLSPSVLHSDMLSLTLCHAHAVSGGNPCRLSQEMLMEGQILGPGKHRVPLPLAANNTDGRSWMPVHMNSGARGQTPPNPQKLKL